MMSKSFPSLDTVAPWDQKVTEYDEAHFVLYTWLLDAVAGRRTEDEMCRILFKREPCERTRLILRSHVKRAQWMSQHGYRQLLK